MITVRGTPIHLVFLILDKFMQRKNPNYIFYLTSALFQIKQDEITELLEESDMLLPYMNKKMKDFQSEKDIEEWFAVADQQSA